MHPGTEGPHAVLVVLGLEVKVDDAVVVLGKYVLPPRGTGDFKDLDVLFKTRIGCQDYPKISAQFFFHGEGTLQ